MVTLGKQTLPTCHDLASNALSNRALPSKSLLHEEFLGLKMASAGGLPPGWRVQQTKNLDRVILGGMLGTQRLGKQYYAYDYERLAGYILK